MITCYAFPPYYFFHNCTKRLFKLNLKMCLFKAIRAIKIENLKKDKYALYVVLFLENFWLEAGREMCVVAQVLYSLSLTLK